MKKLQKKDLKLLLLIAAIFVVGTGIAFAALSATLTLTFGTITQNSLQWDIAFQGSSASPTVGGTSATGRSCGTATITSTSVTVAATTLSKPGDKCTYELTVANSGTVNAKLTSITPTAPTSTVCGTLSSGNMVCGNITYKLTSDSTGNTLLPTNTNLNSGATQTMYLVISYNADTLSDTEITQSGAKFSLVYDQL